MSVELNKKTAQSEVFVRDMKVGQIGEVVACSLLKYYGLIVQHAYGGVLVGLGTSKTWSPIHTMPDNFRVRILEDGETLTVRNNQ